MRLLRLLFSAGFLMGLVATGHAQSPWTMGINFTYDHALSDFGNNIHSSPVGMSFIGMYRIPNSKFSVGGDLGIAMFAHKKYELSLEERGYSGATVTVDEEDCYLNYNAVLRYTLVEDGLFVPYAEARAGGISFFNTKLYDRPEGPGAPKKIDDEFDFLGTTWQTGFGGGIMLDLSQALPM
ncbi:MAG: hypothetical protein AAGB22_12030, partial [Bacteroidota bacterium]